MLSAINNNNPSFTSVIPIRVFIDNMESFSPKLTRAATRQLTTTLAGPVKGDSKKYDIIRKFAQRDPDYDFCKVLKVIQKLGTKNMYNHLITSDV